MRKSWAPMGAVTSWADIPFSVAVGVNSIWAPSRRRRAAAGGDEHLTAGHAVASEGDGLLYYDTLDDSDVPSGAANVHVDTVGDLVSEGVTVAIADVHGLGLTTTVLIVHYEAGNEGTTGKLDGKLLVLLHHSGLVEEGASDTPLGGGSLDLLGGGTVGDDGQEAVSTGLAEVVDDGTDTSGIGGRHIIFYRETKMWKGGKS